LFFRTIFLNLTSAWVFFKLLIGTSCFAQSTNNISLIDSFTIRGDIKITIDKPLKSNKNWPVSIIYYALPNGNTTAQTMGKKMLPGDDWHFDIQHIKAQTNFLRLQMKRQQLIVVYLENKYKSWPLWKQNHADFSVIIPHLIDSLTNAIAGSTAQIYLNGHSGGGSFIFGYLAGVAKIPATIKRISFLDSDYGYDSSYYIKLKNWIINDNQHALNVFAYNDSIALYDGKPFVSATGGTWYRSHLFLSDLQNDFTFTHFESDSLIVHKNKTKQIQFYFKKNIDRGIYHTQQVALNGFIHSILCGTKKDSRKYKYYGAPAYTSLIE